MTPKTEDSKFISKEGNKKNFTFTNTVRLIKSWFVFHSDYGGRMESLMDFELTTDGRINVNQGYDWVEFTPEQVELLYKLSNGNLDKLPREE